ncbi:hypothetical protein [Nonomuraea lactucae]|nr:hypothetical protein [Nonomuraea lactucae]
MASRTLEALRATAGADAGPELAVAVTGMPVDRLDEPAAVCTGMRPDRPA